MTKPSIKAQIIDDTLVIADEFSMGVWDGKPLTWRVLDISENSLCIISRDTLDEIPFNENGGAVTWGNSSLRSWLNTDFLEGSFSSEEIEAFIATNLTTEGNFEYEVEGSQPTIDTLFCLSFDELTHYLPLEQNRAAYGENGCWWLRNPGGAQDYVAYVHNNGWVNTYGYESGFAHVAVRPAGYLALNQIEFIYPEEDKNSLNSDLLKKYSITKASTFGMDAMLDLMESSEIQSVSSFISWFGVDESWESTLVDLLTNLGEVGNAPDISLLYELTGGVEYPGLALAYAIANGNMSAARTLIRFGASLDGKVTKVSLINDTPELFKSRRDGYSQEDNLYEIALNGESSSMMVKELIAQGSLTGTDLQGILKCAAADEEKRSLFAWIMDPDNNPIPGLGARWEKKRIILGHKSPKKDVSVSVEGVQLFWHPDLLKGDAETVRAIAPYLNNPQMEGKRELICFMAKQGWTSELRTMLSGRKIFTPKMIAAALDEAQRAHKKSTVALLTDFLKSVGAGNLLKKDK